MCSSLITIQGSSFWNFALKIDTTGLSRMNWTLVRKYTTSTVHEHVPEIKQSAANLLFHSLRVAESNYAIYDKQKKAVDPSNLVKDVQRSTFEEGDKGNTEDLQKYSSKMSSKKQGMTKFLLKIFSVATLKKGYLFSWCKGSSYNGG